MSYTATLDKANRFIEVEYRGVINASQVNDALSDRARLAHQHEITHHLIECSRVEDVPSISSLYWIAENIREVLRFPIRKVAMVVPHSVAVTTKLQFFVLTIHNRGIHIELFDNRLKAVSWLVGNEKRALSASE